MTALRSLVAAVSLTALAACGSLPARPAGGMVVDLTEDALRFSCETMGASSVRSATMPPAGRGVRGAARATGMEIN